MAYHDILSSIEAFTREHKSHSHHGGESVGDEKDGLISEFMEGLEPLLKEDVETLGKLEVLVRKYTRSSTEVGKVRWSSIYDGMRSIPDHYTVSFQINGLAWINN